MKVPHIHFQKMHLALRWWVVLAAGLVVATRDTPAQTSSLPTVTIRLTSGASLRGRLTAVNDKEVRVQTSKEIETKPLAEVLQITFTDAAGKGNIAPEAPHAQLRLTTGTMLIAQIIEFREKQLECRLFNGRVVAVPMERLHWVLFAAQDAKARTELEQALAKKPNQDLVLVLSRDQQAINTFAGVILNYDEKAKRLNFRTDDDVVPIGANRLRGMVFARRAEEQRSEAVRIVDRFGNTWVATGIAWEKDRIRLESGEGLRADLELSQLVSVDLSQGRLVYLSDLEPLRVEEKPILADVWHYRRDRNLSGGPISLGQRIYDKGLTLHSRTVLEYHVEGYREFRCLVGMEDSVQGAAKALVRIEGDGRELLQVALSTGDKPREVTLPIEGVVRLRLIADYGDDLDLGDHVAFAEARVLK